MSIAFSKANHENATQRHRPEPELLQLIFNLVTLTESFYLTLASYLTLFASIEGVAGAADFNTHVFQGG